MIVNAKLVIIVFFFGRRLYPANFYKIIFYRVLLCALE